MRFSSRSWLRKEYWAESAGALESWTEPAGKGEARIPPHSNSPIVQSPVTAHPQWWEFGQCYPPFPRSPQLFPLMHVVAGSHNWSVAFLSPGSGAMRGSVTLNGVGSLIAAGSGSAAAVGSGEHSVQRDGKGWLDSGSGVGLEWSSTGQTEKNSPLFSSTHSTQAAKFSLGPFGGRRALHRSLRLVM